jgi:hypothetical protein
MHKLFFTLILSLICLNGFSQDTLQLINGNKIVVSTVSVEADDIVYKKPDSGKLRKIDPFKVFSILYKDGTERVIFTSDTLDPLDFKVDEMRNFIKGEQQAKLLYKTYLVPSIGLAIGAAPGMLAMYGLVGPPLYATVLGTFSPNIEKQHTFKVSGNAVQSLSIQPGKYLNEVKSSSNASFKKDQKLCINGSSIRFKKDTDLNEAVGLINSKFNCSRVRAMNDEGKLKLFKADSTALIKDSSYKEGYSKKVREKRITNGLISGFFGYLVVVVTLALVSK